MAIGTGGKSHYCEIITRNEKGEATFFRGQASSYRVAAERAVARMVCENSASDNGQPGKWENVSVKTGRVGA